MNTVPVRNAVPPAPRAPVVQVAPVQAAPTAPDRVPARAAPAPPFADLLRRQRAEASPPAPPPGAPEGAMAPDEGDADDANDGNVDASPEKPLSPARMKARSAAPAQSPATVDPSLREGSAVAETRAREERAAEAGNDRAARPAEPTPLRPLPMMEESAARAGSAGLASARDAVPATDRDDSAGRVRAQPPGGRSAADAARAQREDGGHAAAAELSASTGAALAPAEIAPSSEAALARPAFELPLHAGSHAALLAAPLAAGESAPSSATTPPGFTLPTPVDSPGFASALGVHVSLLARGGVQEAELHLNPADMGPVSIRIQLDGTEAQVQFGADLAPTRQAIEAGLPELASALREAGFTLSGGGVSPHAGQHGRDDARAPPRRPASAGGADADADGTHIARTVRRFAEGGLDVYA